MNNNGKNNHYLASHQNITPDERLTAQHARGKLSARERISLLLDGNTFHEISCSNEVTDSVITGYGEIDGRQVYIYAQDFTVLGGTISLAEGQKVAKVMEQALEHKVPIIGIHDSGGARIQDGVTALAGVGEILLLNTQCSGIIPQIAIVVGPCAGGAAYSPALCDFVFTVKGISQLYVTGPDVVKHATNECVSHQELGGAEVHNTTSGVSHFIFENEAECFKQVKRLLSFLPPNSSTMAPVISTDDPPERIDDSLSDMVPTDQRKPYDMLGIIERIVDNGNFLELQSQYAANIICGLARLDGRTVGIVAQQPLVLAGTIDINASVKAARFVRFCDTFNLPIISLVDVPGFIPGSQHEHDGIIRHGAKLVYAYAKATVPKISLITRKAYGGAYIAMSSKHLGGNINYAWPKAKISIMGAEAAVSIIFRKEIARSLSPAQTCHDLAEKYRMEHDNTQQATNLGYIDQIIEPRYTRPMLIQALTKLCAQQKNTLSPKHGNIPL